MITNKSVGAHGIAGKVPICSHCNDAARASLAQELRGVLRANKYSWIPLADSDLINVMGNLFNEIEFLKELLAKTNEEKSNKE
jgi:hypothetical protein